MSFFEDPVSTLVRLLKRYVRVAKADGSLANVDVSSEWCNRELLKNCDGQITVGLERSEDQKLSFDGNLRRRLSFLRLNVWVTDKPEKGVVGRNMREKIRAEVMRVIHERRSKPNTVDYNFSGVGCSVGTHKAFHVASANELAPTDSNWTELTDDEYAKLWYSDDTRFSKSASNDGEYAMMLFRFKLDADAKVLKRIVLSFEGYGTAPNGNGAVIKVWNFSASAWQNAVSGSGGADETLTIVLDSNLNDYVRDGYAYLLAKTAHPSNGSTSAILHCDFAEICFTVNGITYADVHTYQDRDDVRVKPFLWRTEFIVKSWLFENVPVT
ncbi:MAG: hypothetical protein QW166_02140 [Candidatus Bathyarchaeia archaeon]